MARTLARGPDGRFVRAETNPAPQRKGAWSAAEWCCLLAAACIYAAMLLAPLWASYVRRN